MPRTSNKQQEILAFLGKFVTDNGYPPSVREICVGVGLKSTASVHYHLGELKRQGLIDVDENKNRAISLPASAMSAAASAAPVPRQIPVLGAVTAGLPILAVENVEGYIPWEGDQSCFALHVRGESMIGAGILDGDNVVVRPQNTAQNGDIVVALLGDEATVKRLHFEDDGVWLIPANPSFSPIDGREATILGKVKAVIRNY